MNIAEVHFKLRGIEFEPDEATTLLGIEPSYVLRQAIPAPKESSWILSSGEVSGETVDVYEMADVIVRQLLPKSREIRELIDKYNANAMLQVVLTISQDEQLSTPAIGFSAEAVGFLAKIS